MSNAVGGDSAVGKEVDPLKNLSAVRTRMDSLQRFLSETVSSNTLLSKDQMAMVSFEISSAIHQIIINGAALLAAPSPPTFPVAPNPDEDAEVVEIDAVELLTELVHLCDVCGKGFKRDANLRMHMRAHGDRFKTPQALAKPASGGGVGPTRRFSCPYEGCNRNRRHNNFRALKSVVCVRNHFKRSHCPKMYACERCNGKSFAVAADLRSHRRHCGVEAARLRCSCGTSFTRKEKLFGHVALFEGHMPAPATEEEEDDSMDGFFDGLIDEFGPVGGDGFGTLQDVLGSPGGGFQVGFRGGFL